MSALTSHRTRRSRASLGLAVVAALLGSAACDAGSAEALRLSWRFADGRGCDLAGIVDVVARAGAAEPLRWRCRDGAAPDHAVDLETPRPATLSLDAETISGAVLYSGRLELEAGDAPDQVVTLRFAGGRAE